MKKSDYKRAVYYGYGLNVRPNKAGTKFARSIHEGTATIRHGKWTAKVRKAK